MAHQVDHIGQPPSLTMVQDFFASRNRLLAYKDLLHDVFGFDPSSNAGLLAPIWEPIAFFEAGGRCVATAETCRLALILDGVSHDAAGLRLVAVAQERRGQGLFRKLMERVLAWNSERGIELALLYTAEPDLYRRFGYQGVPQHAFIGEAPRAVSGQVGRAVDANAAHDRALIERALMTRAPVSRQVAMIAAPALALERLRADADLALYYAPDLEALIVYEEEDDALVIVDVVAPAMPSLAQVLAALPRRAMRVKTLFAPDLLAWNGRPIEDETGLMALGALPAAMQRPFMLPPTTEF